MTGKVESTKVALTKLSTHSYDSDISDNDEVNQDQIKTGWNLYEKIFSYLDPPSLLESRLVCQRWNRVISNSPKLLWSSLRVKVHHNGYYYKSTGASSSPLTQAPNFAFQTCDLRHEFFRHFFAYQANLLKHLKIQDSIVTLPNLQTIIVSCEELEHLELWGISSALAFSESVFPKPFQYRRLTKLKTLILKAMEPPPACIFEQNLHPGFLQDIIEYSVNLESVHLANWSGRTLNSFMNIVNQRVRYHRFVDFQATQIRSPLRSIDLIPLCVHNAHIKLKKLTISPATPYQRHEFGIMIVRGILRNHRLSLEELDLSNCPVNASIFKFDLPRLGILTAIHTNMSSTVQFKKFVPNLKRAQFHFGRDTTRDNIGELLANYNFPSFQAFERHFESRLLFLLKPCNIMDCRKSDGRSLIKEFDACSMFDFVCLVLFAMAFLTLFLFALSSLFRAYSPLIFAGGLGTIFVWELYDYMEGTSKACQYF